jgi:hypothetical protein
VRWHRSLADPVGPLKTRGDHKEWIRLVGDHPFEHCLIGNVRHYTGVQFILSFARLGRENVPGKRMLPDHLPRPGLFEPFRRTFVGL